VVFAELGWTGLQRFDQLAVALNWYWWAFLGKFLVWTCWKAGAGWRNTFQLQIAFDFVPETLYLHYLSFENGILFHKDFVDSVELSLNGKFQVFNIVDDLSFKGIKLLVQFVFLFFNSFLKVVQISFFILQEFGKFRRKKFDLFEWLPEVFGFDWRWLRTVDGWRIIFRGDASLAVYEIGWAVAGERGGSTHLLEICFLDFIYILMVQYLLSSLFSNRLFQFLVFFIHVSKLWIQEFMFK
jgi:hypothetical protein